MVAAGGRRRATAEPMVPAPPGTRTRFMRRLKLSDGDVAVVLLDPRERARQHLEATQQANVEG
jgi:hypothetical protein